MRRMRWLCVLFALACCARASAATAPTTAGSTDELPRVSFNNPSLITDLGVGLWGWPLPMEFNGDGLMDLVVVCTGVPSNGIWYFENSGQIEPATNLPVFKPARYLGP